MAQVNTFTCSVDLQDFCHGNDAKANCEGRGTCHRICQLPQYIVLRDELSLRQKNKILQCVASHSVHSYGATT